MLSTLSTYIQEIPPLAVDGIYGNRTRAAVLAAQRRFRLPETGTVDAITWDRIYDQYSGIENTTLRSEETFPNGGTSSSSRRNQRNSSNAAYSDTSTATQFPGRDLVLGTQDPVRQEVVR